jgi:hypothetical protein
LFAFLEGPSFGGKSREDLTIRLVNEWRPPKRLLGMCFEKMLTTLVSSSDD